MTTDLKRVKRALTKNGMSSVFPLIDQSMLDDLRSVATFLLDHMQEHELASILAGMLIGTHGSKKAAMEHVDFLLSLKS